MQPTLGIIKKTLKFVWRHFFTIYCLIEIIRGYIFTNPIFNRVLIIIGVAIAIDWAKQFIKLSRKFEVPSNMNDPFNIATPLHKRQWWNPELYGSSTNILNRHDQIKYD